MLNLTVESVLELNPCKKYTREYVTELFNGRESVTLIEAMQEAKLPIVDRFWLCFNTLAAKGYNAVVQNFTIHCAENILPFFEQVYTDDKRPRLAIQAAKDYQKGLISLEALQEAKNAAYAAAYMATHDAARAAYAAAHTAAAIVYVNVAISAAYITVDAATSASKSVTTKVEKQHEFLKKLIELIQNI